MLGNVGYLHFIYLLHIKQTAYITWIFVLGIYTSVQSFIPPGYGCAIHVFVHAFALLTLLVGDWFTF